MYFHTDDAHTVLMIAEAATRAAAQGRSLRLNVTADGTLTYKVGEGGWSPPTRSTVDPYRDVPQYRETHVSAHDGSPVMSLGFENGLLVLMNEDGYTWRDNPKDWRAI